MSSERAGFTPGPWAWFGNAKTNRLYLATVHGGRQYVMDFARWGMRGAQPRFQTERGLMTDAKDLLQFEVGTRSVVGVEQAKADPSVYRLDVRGISSANARLIAAAPDMFEGIEDARSQAEMLLLAIIEGDPTLELQVRVNDILEVLRRASDAALSRAGGSHGL